MIAAHRAAGGIAIVATHGEIALAGADRLDLGLHAGHGRHAGRLTASDDGGGGPGPEHESW